jgi:hypothetical protein
MSSFLRKKVAEAKKTIKKALPKNYCRKGTVHGHHKILKIVKDKDGQIIAVECNCTARVTHHPVYKGKPQWSKVAVIVFNK